MLLFHWIILYCMGKTWSVYISDDDLNQRIKDAIESEEYHNQAHLFNKAVKEMLDDENDIIT